MKIIFLLLFLFGCHDLSNHHDSVALECDVGVQTRDHIILRFTNPGGIDLSPEQLSQLQVKYARPEGTQSIAASPKACVVLPTGAAQVAARIGGEQPLKADLSLSPAAVTGIVIPVELRTPGYLSLQLKCPKNGLLASDSLGDVVEVTKSLGDLVGYQINLSVVSQEGQSVSLFAKDPLESGFKLPASFDLKGIAEGSYVLKLDVADPDHTPGNISAQNQCNMIVRRSCAKEEDFDPKTISCVPKLCDNAFRIGTSWNENLRLQRGEGRYECRLSSGKAEKILLSHTCRAGFFKSPTDCLAAKKIEDTCALLENDQVSCWGTQIAKEIFSDEPTHDYNYQKTFQFPEKVVNFDNWCVGTESGRAFCWGLTYTDPVGYYLKTDAASPKTWDQVYPKGFIQFKELCGITKQGELWCGLAPNGEGGIQIHLPEKVVDFGLRCAADIKGQLWCFKGNQPDNQLIDASTVSSDDYYLVTNLPGPVVSSRSEVFSTCTLLVSGKILCWGNNVQGAVGSNSPSLRVKEPAFVVDSQGSHLSQMIQLKAVHDSNGGATYFALHQDGRVFSWGANLLGQLANGTPGEDDEGNPLFSRFAVPVTVEAKNPVIVP